VTPAGRSGFRRPSTVLPRAILGVHQERLADAAEREQQRRHWQGVITALVKALTRA
jgi:hypothetical protein